MPSSSSSPPYAKKSRTCSSEISLVVQMISIHIALAMTAALDLELKKLHAKHLVLLKKTGRIWFVGYQIDIRFKLGTKVSVYPI